MGGGVFSLDTYNQAKKARAATGQADFGYTNKMRNLAPSERKASKVLDVFGVKLREARDSDEHPNSTPVAVLFDVTGSMGSVPRTLQKKLGELFNILEASPDVEDPQLLVGAIGDDEYDRVPIQIGQFESDNRVDEQLREIYIEGGGGGDKREAYALAAHFMGTKVETDAWQKRQKKGYLFIIGDEMNKQALFADSIRKWLGDEAEENIAIERVYEVLKEKWDVYYVLPNLTSYYNDPQIENHWKPLVGERFTKLPDPDGIAEFIGETVAANERAFNRRTQVQPAAV